MRKTYLIISLLLMFGVASAAPTFQAEEYHSETEQIRMGSKDEEITYQLSDGGTTDFYTVGTLDMDTWNDLEEIRILQYQSLGDDYTEIFDGYWVGEYFDDLTNNENPTVEYDDTTGGQDEEYNVLYTDGDPYMVLDYETGEVSISQSVIDGDQGFDFIEITFYQGLDPYEAGYNDGVEEKTPKDAYFGGEDNRTVVETNDGDIYEFGTTMYGDAYDTGYDEGTETDNFNFGWVTAFFGLFQPLFGAQLLPGLTIGTIVGIVIVLRLGKFVLSWWRG